jgi:hypothetical protein
MVGLARRVNGKAEGCANVRISFPHFSQIRDLTPELSRKFAGSIEAEISATVAYLRATDDTERQRIQRLSDTTLRIFRLLFREKKVYGDVEALRGAVRTAAEAAVCAIHFVYRQSGYGRMTFLWHDDIELQLHYETERIETEWWANQADIKSIPTLPPAVLTRAPRTETAASIEAYLHKVCEETGIKVNKTDFWLRPVKKDGTSRYHSDRGFRAYQKEDPGLSSGVKKLFNHVLRMPSREFVEGLEERRRQLKLRRNTKVRR